MMLSGRNRGGTCTFFASIHRRNLHSTNRQRHLEKVNDCRTLFRLEHVTVNPVRDGNISMAQNLAHDFHGHSPAKHQRPGSVAKVMRADGLNRFDSP